VAVDYFARGRLLEAATDRRVRFAAAQKALLVRVLTALVCSERTPSFPARRAILRQIEDLGLPRDLENGLRKDVKRAFERRPQIKEVVANVQSQEVKRFVVEQTLLASLVDGHRSAREVEFLYELGSQL